LAVSVSSNTTQKFIIIALTLWGVSLMKAAEVTEPVEDKATRERNIRRTSREKRSTSLNHKDTERISKTYRTVR